MTRISMTRHKKETNWDTRNIKVSPFCSGIVANANAIINIKSVVLSRICNEFWFMVRQWINLHAYVANSCQMRKPLFHFCIFIAAFYIRSLNYAVNIIIHCVVPGSSSVALHIHFCPDDEVGFKFGVLICSCQFKSSDHYGENRLFIYCYSAISLPLFTFSYT